MFGYPHVVAGYARVYRQSVLISPSRNTLYKNITIWLYFSPNMDIFVYLFNVLVHFLYVFGGIKCLWYMLDMGFGGYGDTRYSGFITMGYYIWAQLPKPLYSISLHNDYQNNQ